ncbi:hypothetical protein GCM10007304_43300 [Rhodococcoides trifolii]|uniref:HTH tetR-type domain-containing protein n=1 Tax=Rhodococcoides trifolii TaxID=908250 RepID=A0A917G663_9NOCA|nr:TetR/AcrR family transcriptional regulator [Rhodococcus trifolii]GGG24768.1 hypothetical protein GCM10007304_43300 [Rhodococcus trifolii]
MPKIVDHDDRRAAIVAAAKRLIAANGAEGMTMRDLATEAGYANGALSYYFAGRQEIVQTAFENVVAATDDRIDAASVGLRGLGALRAMCCEILPLTKTTVLESRVVLALWQFAASNPSMASLDNAAIDRWTQALRGHLRDAIADGEVAEEVPVELKVDVLMHFMVGMQVTAALNPDAASSAVQRSMLDDVIGSWRTR